LPTNFDIDMKRSDIELMAPVGSYESLMAAVQAGADSIYFGVSGLNMRSRSANNFSLDDLHKIVGICKENNMKSYLTVNTVLYDNDLARMHDVVDAAKESGLTAIIASDISAIQYANEVGVEIHISTQCNISNYEAVKFYAKFADVLVLARELTLTKVKNIYDKIIEDDLRGPKGELIKIEMFAHGALCMAVSGKCYLSLHEMNASANKGACMQVCRREYTVKDKEKDIELDIENEYIMSPKDLCTIGFLNKMIDAGVRVLKFEGRARSQEYVKTVVTCYEEAVNAICEGNYEREKIDAWKERLSTVFNRGFWNGYYLGQRLGEWSEVYGSKATKRREYIAKNTNYYSKMGIAEFKMDSGEIAVGDEIIITGPNTGVIELKIEEIRVDFEKVNKAVKGEIFSILVPEKIRKADKVYKLELVKSNSIR
jgi:putative protease